MASDTNTISCALQFKDILSLPSQSLQKYLYLTLLHFKDRHILLKATFSLDEDEIIYFCSNLSQSKREDYYYWKKNKKFTNLEQRSAQIDLLEFFCKIIELNKFEISTEIKKKAKQAKPQIQTHWKNLFFNAMKEFNTIGKLKKIYPPHRSLLFNFTTKLTFCYIFFYIDKELKQTYLDLINKTQLSSYLEELEYLQNLKKNNELPLKIFIKKSILFFSSFNIKFISLNKYQIEKFKFDQGNENQLFAHDIIESFKQRNPHELEH